MPSKLEDLEELLKTQDTKGAQHISGVSTIQDTVLRVIAVVIDQEKRLMQLEKKL